MKSDPIGSQLHNPLLGEAQESFVGSTIQQFKVDTTKFPGTPSGDAWLSGTITSGNNVDAYLDRDGNNAPDSLTDHNAGLDAGRAFSAKQDFTFTFTANTDPRQFGPAAVTNLFFYSNQMHDWMYTLGFTETARNFQTNNFGRGGSGNDPVKAEAQDGSGTNNANFATPADGSSGRMQQYIFTAPTPDRDSDLDGDVVLHEYGHGVSNRLIGNGSGLGGTQSGAMGEGWSDYLALAREVVKVDANMEAATAA